MSRFAARFLPPVAALVVVVLAVMHQLVLNPGYIIYRDLFPGQLYYPTLWQSEGSFLGIENFKFVTFTGWWLPLQALGLDVYEKFVYVSGFVAAFLAFYIAIYRLLGWVEENRPASLLLRHLVSSLAALVYVASPAAANIYFDFSLWVGYAFAPLTLILYMEALAGRRRRLPAVLLIGSIWWMSAIKAHWIVFGALLFIPPLLAWGRKTWQAKEFVRGSAMTAGIVLVYLLLSAYWLLPFLQVQEGRFVGSSAPMTLEAVRFLSNTPLDKVVRLMGAFQAWPYVVYDSPLPALSGLWLACSWIIPLVVLAGVYFYRQHWQAQAVGLLAGAGILLAKGLADPFGEIYQFLVFGPLTPESYRWLFRVASKWNVFISLGYCFLIGLGLYAILTRTPKWLGKRFPRLISSTRWIYLGGSALFGLSFVFFAWPSFSGDFRGALAPVPLPAELQSANQWLAQVEGDHKVHWMPVTNGRELSWNQKPSGDFYAGISPMPSIATNWNRHPVLYYSYAYEALVNQRLNSFGKLMSILNTRYLAYHNDIISTHIHTDVEPVSVLIEPGEEKIPVQLQKQTDVQLVKKDGFIDIFQTNQDTGSIFVPQRQFLSTGGLSTLTSLSAIQAFQPAENAILFDASRSSGTFDQALDGLMLDRTGLDQLQFAFLPAEKLISPAVATLHGVPTENWARLDIYQFDWQSLLHTYAIDNWDFDYGAGIAAYTDEFGAPGQPAQDPQVLKIPVKVDQSGDYQVWVRSLKLPRAAILHIAVDEREQASLDNRADQTGLYWENSGSVHLEKGSHIISLQSSHGLSAVNVLALLSADEAAQMQKQGHELASRVANLYQLEAESDFGKVKAADLLSDSAYSAGQAVQLHSSTTLSSSLNLVAPGAYQLAVRVSAGISPDALRVSLAGQQLKLHVDRQDGPLEWLGSDPLELASGPLSIQVESQEKSVVDTLILYRGVDSADLQEFFTQKKDPPVTVSFEKIDSTRYRVQVNAARPYTLALAETYDPLWVASGTDFQVKSVPLYGVINGFSITKTGMYEFTLEYQPQQAARLGQIISFAIAILCGILFLVISRIQNRY